LSEVAEQRKTAGGLARRPVVQKCGAILDNVPQIAEVGRRPIWVKRSGISYLLLSEVFSIRLHFIDNILK